MSKKSLMRACFEKEYGKLAKALLKFALRQIYHIHWSLATKLRSENLSY